MMVGTSGGQQEKRFGDRRKSDERPAGESGANLVLSEIVKRDRASVSVANRREEGSHRKLFLWDQDGNCHEGKTPCLGSTTMFVESTWLAPIDSDVTISLVLGEEDSVGHELAQGKTLWHCPHSDEFGNHAGFGVLFQREWPQSPGSGAISGSKEGT